MDQETRTLLYVLLAVVIGGAIRAIKSDRIPFNIRPTMRPYVSMGLGQVGAVVDLLASGLSWQNAIRSVVLGLMAGALPIAGHETVAKSIEKKP